MIFAFAFAVQWLLMFTMLDFFVSKLIGMVGWLSFLLSYKITKNASLSNNVGIKVIALTWFLFLAFVTVNIFLKADVHPILLGILFLVSGAIWLSTTIDKFLGYTKLFKATPTPQTT